MTISGLQGDQERELNIELLEAQICVNGKFFLF